MKQAGSTDTTPPHESPSGERIKRRNEWTAGTVLSEVTLNIGNAQDYRSLSVRKSNIQNVEASISDDNVINKPEKSDEQENFYETMKIAQVRRSDIYMDQSSSRNVIPIQGRTDMEGYLSGNRRDFSDETKEAIDVNRSLAKKERKKAFQTDANTEFVVQKEKDCQSCKVVEHELKILTAKMKELEMKLRPSLDTKMRTAENLLKQIQDERSLNTIITDEKCWKASYEQLERQINDLQNDMVIQKEHYQKELEESCNEKERLNIELLKVDEKISILEKEAEKVEKENLKYISIIQEMRNNSAKQFDEQKNEVRRSVEVNQIAKKQLYHSSESMAAQLELMLKQTCEDNFKLHAYLEKAEKALESRELQTIGSEEFRQQVQKKLHELLRKFKNEAIKSDLMWLGEKNIQYAIDNFEATIETILQNRPCFHSLAKRLEVLMEQSQLSKSNDKKESAESQESQALMTFKRRFRKEIRSVLEEFKEKQKNELSANISAVLNYLEDANKRVDASLTMRVENMTDMVALIDRKQCDLHKIEEALDYDRALVKSFSDRMKTRLQWRSDLSNFDEEKCKLKEACSQLGDGYMRLEEMVENMEKLRKQFFSSTFTPHIDRSGRIHLSEPGAAWRKKMISKPLMKIHRLGKSIADRELHHERIVRRRVTEGMSKNDRND